MSSKNYQPITVRPAQALRPALEQLAGDLGKSEGQVLSDLAADALEMLEKNSNFVPKVVRAARALRAHDATFTAGPQAIEKRDKREVSFYDSIQAGTTSGVCADNPPGKIQVPDSIKAHVDFAVRVYGDSMESMIHAGNIAFFRSAEEASDGRIVCAVVEGQMMMKMFKAANGGPALLVSLNQAYDPIPWTAETRIQGVYEGKMPGGSKKKTRPRTLEAATR